MNWVSIPGGRYDLLEGGSKKSQCQIEISCKYVQDEGFSQTTDQMDLLQL